jgi:chemotaxis protein MotA
MDPATLAGILLGFAIVAIANILEGGSPAAMFLLPPMLLVFGTSILISTAGMTIPDVKRAVSDLIRAIKIKPTDPTELVEKMVELTGRARKEGLLALEESLGEIEDQFLVDGVTLAVDGTDPEELREILEAKVWAFKSANKTSVKFFADMGAYAPTIGIIGTVMGLVHVLENLAQPEELGHLIAAAFLATLWGVTSANVIWLPISSRIKRINELDVERMELIVEGVLAIQSGKNPRLVSQKLNAMIPVTGKKKDADAEVDA